MLFNNINYYYGPLIIFSSLALVLWGMIDFFVFKIVISAWLKVGLGFVLSIGHLIYYLIQAVRSYRFCSKNIQLNSECPHAKILIADYNKLFRLQIHKDRNVESLVKKLRKNNIPYKIIEDVGKKEIFKAFEDEKTRGVFIFGHGCRHGVRITSDEYFYYCNLKKNDNIKYVAQLHCNEKGGKAAKEVLNCEGFVNDEELTGSEITEYIKKEEYLKYFKDLGV